MSSPSIRPPSETHPATRFVMLSDSSVKAVLSMGFSEGLRIFKAQGGDLLDFKKRPNGSHFLPAKSRDLLTRLFENEIELACVPASDLISLQMDLKHLSLRSGYFEPFAQRSGAHQAHATFVDLVARQAHSQVAWKVLEGLVGEKGAQVEDKVKRALSVEATTLGREILLVLGVSEFYRDRLATFSTSSWVLHPPPDLRPLLSPSVVMSVSDDDLNFVYASEFEGSALCYRQMGGGLGTLTWQVVVLHLPEESLQGFDWDQMKKTHHVELRDVVRKHGKAKKLISSSSVESTSQPIKPDPPPLHHAFPTDGKPAGSCLQEGRGEEEAHQDTKTGKESTLESFQDFEHFKSAPDHIENSAPAEAVLNQGEEEIGPPTRNLMKEKKIGIGSDTSIAFKDDEIQVKQADYAHTNEDSDKKEKALDIAQVIETKREGRTLERLGIEPSQREDTRRDVRRRPIPLPSKISKKTQSVDEPKRDILSDPPQEYGKIRPEGAQGKTADSTQLEPARGLSSKPQATSPCLDLSPPSTPPKDVLDKAPAGGAHPENGILFEEASTRGLLPPAQLSPSSPFSPFELLGDAVAMSVGHKDGRRNKEEDPGQWKVMAAAGMVGVFALLVGAYSAFKT